MRVFRTFGPFLPIHFEATRTIFHDNTATTGDGGAIRTTENLTITDDNVFVPYSLAM